MLLKRLTPGAHNHERIPYVRIWKINWVSAYVMPLWAIKNWIRFRNIFLRSIDSRELCLPYSDIHQACDGLTLHWSSFAEPLYDQLKLGTKNIKLWDLNLLIMQCWSVTLECAHSGLSKLRRGVLYSTISGLCGVAKIRSQSLQKRTKSREKFCLWAQRSKSDRKSTLDYWGVR